MKKLESSLKNMVGVLLAITVISALTLSSVYSVTKDPIEKSKMAKQQNAIKEVIPGFDHLSLPEKVKIDTGDSLTIFKAYDKNNVFIGAAVESLSKKGFGGEIKIMVGFDKEGNIINYSVLEQKETPGLGTKMVDWFKTSVGNQDIRGKNPAKNNLTVKKDGGEVDAITAATISSRAFLDAIRNAYVAYAKNFGYKVDFQSGATKKADSRSGSTKINK